MDFLITEFSQEQRTQLQISENAALALRACTETSKRDCFYWDWSEMMLPLFSGVLSSLFTRLFCAVPRASVARIA